MQPLENIRVLDLSRALAGPYLHDDVGRLGRRGDKSGATRNGR